ncbi:alpha/beta hydrolase [Flavobacterium wongokense]|uniref:alpha/beta hydrolase n=1 Tax=Flavobacterium wongokense TaxID=2910674 RepID=UPI001EEA8AD7|nr:alpha/beta hydrolase-fold protein [Flavobacterium sp. WG47]MCF6132950.1 alpha/beta hydrolase [Flavobacterium sp. WG47]
MKYFFSLLTLFILSSLNAQQSTTGKQVSTFSIEAPQLKSSKKIWVYLPKGYSTSSKRYPVIYMHDAQNLFDAKTSYVGEWNVDETLDSINAKVIVIGIEHGGDKRIEELTPFRHEKYGGGKADDYLDFIVNTLKPKVDATYRTKTDAKNTAIFGSSLGGLVSFYAAIKYPTVFGKVGCFSPSFWFGRNDMNELLAKTKDFDAKVYFLCGDNEGDGDVIPDMRNVEHWVNTKRCPCKKLNKEVIVKGGQHNEKLWRESFKKAYLWLF